MRSLTRFLRNHSVAALLVLLAAAHVALIGVFMSHHTAPPRWDDSLYLAQSELFFAAMRGNDAYAGMYYGLSADQPAFLWTLFSRLMGDRAPLIALVPIPAYAVLGTGKAALTATYAGLVCLYLFISFRLAARLTDPWTALIAVAITSSMPLLLGLSRAFWVEYPLMILVSLWLYLQLISENFTDTRFAVPLGIVLGLGMLMKIAFPVYIVGPAVWALWSLVRRGGAQVIGRRLALNALIISAVGAALMSGWYQQNAHAVLSYAFRAGLGTWAEGFSFGEPTRLGTLLLYWGVVIVAGISVYYFLLAVALLIWRRLHRLLPGVGRRSASADPPVQAGFVAVWLLVPLAFFSLGVNKEVRYVAPVLPAAGLLTAWLIRTSFAGARPSWIAVPALLAFPFYAAAYVTLPLRTTTSVSLGPIPLLLPNVAYAARPVREVWPQPELLDVIQRDARRHALVLPRVGIVPVHEYLNGNSLLYSSIHGGYRASIVGFLSPDIEAAFLASEQEAEVRQRERLLAMDYLIAKTGDQGPAGYYNAAILPALLNGELPFVEIARFPLPDESTAMVYRRVQ